MKFVRKADDSASDVGDYGTMEQSEAVDTVESVARRIELVLWIDQ